MWNENFELPDRPYSILDIQDYFECKTVTDNPPVRVYVNKIENRITFKIKTRCYLELLTPELLGSTESKITRNGNAENAPPLEITDID